MNENITESITDADTLAEDAALGRGLSQVLLDILLGKIPAVARERAGDDAAKADALYSDMMGRALGELAVTVGVLCHLALDRQGALAAFTSDVEMTMASELEALQQHLAQQAADEAAAVAAAA